MPRMIDAHIDRALTNISVAYIQNNDAFIADKVFPMIPVNRQSDIYYTYKREDFFRDSMRERGAGVESAGGDYNVAPADPYYCRKFALHKDVTEEERLNYDEPLDAEMDASIFLTQQGLIRRENDWAQKYFKTGVWGRELTGIATGTPTANQFIKFSNTDASDPIGVITSAAVEMASVTAFRPNTLVMTPRVFYAIKNNFDILDRIKYTQRGVVTTDLLASLFEVDRVLVSWSVTNAAQPGAAEDNDFTLGDNILLAYSAPRPALRTPSAGYIFTWTGMEGAGAYGNRIIRIDQPLLGLNTQRIENEMAFDAKVIAPDMGVFLTSVI